VIALDTNVLVRLVLRDDEAKAQRARTLFEANADNDGSLFVSDVGAHGVRMGTVQPPSAHQRRHRACATRIARIGLGLPCLISCSDLLPLPLAGEGWGEGVTLGAALARDQLRAAVG
jgi:predicted nucleic acid-binding protein